MKEKISLETFGNKQFRVKLIEPENNQAAIFLENEKGLRNHNEGKNLATILNVSRNDFGIPIGRVFRFNFLAAPHKKDFHYTP